MDGKIKIDCKYERVEDFEDGLAYIFYEQGSGFIDSNGNEYWED
jgi:hypothetical protein